MAKVTGISISHEKGVSKENIPQGIFIADWGLEGDAHAGKWHRQVSFLAEESIDKMKAKSPIDLTSGIFAENITTVGIELHSLPVGTIIKISDVIFEVTQIGKECHSKCNIFHQVGSCVMPKEGIFARVVKGGIIKTGDEIKVIKLKYGIITASDKGFKGEREDLSCKMIEQEMDDIGYMVNYKLLPDDRKMLSDAMIELCDMDINIIFTTGGTGFSQRDITPEATLDVVEKLVPGIPEAMRAESMKITNRAMLSRAVAGIRGNTLIINLPGSPKAVKENLQVVKPILEHAIDTLKSFGGDCAR